MIVTQSPLPVLTVVGIGADGWSGLTDAARTALTDAAVILGGDRQLVLLPADLPGLRRSWPSPLLPALPGLLAEYRQQRTVVLASGDPMFYGIGNTLARMLGPDAFTVIGHPSSAALACARLGWPVQDTATVSVVGRPTTLLHPAIGPGRRLLVLSADADSPAAIAALLVQRGYPLSRIHILEQLGGPHESIRVGTATALPTGPYDPLNVVAVECLAAPDAPLLGHTPGLPDDAYDNDGQLTKREVRAITLARLVPVPGQLLWDVGGGTGTVGIEWMRSHPRCQAISIEPRAERVDRIRRNADSLGVPGLQVVHGSAPAALAGLPAPDAIFIGGGLTAPGVVEAAWAALRPGGRLVANAVTVETEVAVAGWRASLGGDLTRVTVSRAAPVGGFTGWRTAMPITQWVVSK